MIGTSSNGRRRKVGLSPPNLSAIAYLTSNADDKKRAETGRGHDSDDESDRPRKKASAKTKAKTKSKANGKR